jgi:hypothetical protein
LQPQDGTASIALARLEPDSPAVFWTFERPPFST